jgi:hypothetical protein
MDTQSQMQAIVDRLTGALSSTLLAPSALDEPWRTIYRRAAPVQNRAEAEILLWDATRGLPGRRQLAQDLATLLPDDATAFNPFPSLQDISGRFPTVDWLWPSWIPRAMLTLFGAAPGAGKSLVALDLARRIIAGLPFPDGTPVPCPGSNVLIVDAEGAPALLNQRARAWDIDGRRLFLMLAPDATGLLNLSDPAQQIRLAKMCIQLKPALVVIDSLAAATSHGETSLQGARSIFGPLTAIARTLDLAMLIIHHLRKRSSAGRSTAAPQITPDDLRGSSHLSAAARFVLALSVPAPTPATSMELDRGSHRPTASPPLALSEMRRLEVVKTNLCRRPPPLGLIFEDPLESSEGPSGMTGETAVSVPTLRYSEYVEPPPPPSQVELCARWLLEFLAAAGEPVRPARVIQAAGECGFSRPTLYRARQILTHSIVDLGNSPRDPNKRWALATSSSPPTAQREDENR